MDKENESSYFTGDFNYNSENFSWLAIEENLENKYLKQIIEINFLKYTLWFTKPNTWRY